MGKLKIVLKLDRILAARGMSGRELSRRTEETGNFVRHRTIHEMMNGTTKHLVIANLVSICEVLGCGLDDLMELQPAEEKEKEPALVGVDAFGFPGGTDDDEYWKGTNNHE